MFGIRAPTIIALDTKNLTFLNLHSFLNLLFFYRIVDRKKDLVKLQHGEYISYGKVEAVLKTCPIVESICLFADSTRDFVVAVMVPVQAELAKLSDKPAKLAIKDPKVQAEVVKILQNYGINQNLLKVELPHRSVLPVV